MVWPARAQVCRLHHCKVPRLALLKQNRNIKVHDDADLYLVDMHAHFVEGRSDVGYASVLSEEEVMRNA